MSINDKLKNILTQLRSHFEQLYGARLTQMVLYGSQARGDAHPDSDIDILVVLKAPVQAGEEIDRTLQIVADLSLQNDEVISCQFMDEQRFIHYNGPLLRNIRQEGMSFLNKPLTGGQDAHPTKNLLFVEQASCLFWRMLKDPIASTFISFNLLYHRPKTEY
ncbi:nucleotidyltransferase domain-containing protein [Microcoleus sp. LAD1_D5]|uniref:nucleotidyltransferase domain-containing protein n=1 Tax=unclassified Microcoleus TaxID=2642155 RepID=UPI002FD62A21